jgi:hypothetical protein
MVTRPLALVTAIVLLGTSSAAAAQERVRVTGVYSNMKLGTEDVTGVEIFIVYASPYDRPAHYATVQCAEGVPGKPFTTKVSVTENAIEFIAPDDRDTLCPPGKFVGTVSAKGLKGTFERTDWPGFLVRKRSYWQ